MMNPSRRPVLITAIALAGAGACGAVSGAAAPDPALAAPAARDAQEAPRLVVLMVIDQLPAYLMERLDGAFTGGLRRLADDGMRFAHATHDHAITETAPGHATIATGTAPAKHGVVANDWWERVNGQQRLVLNVVDPGTPVLDDPLVAGASPAKLRREGLADWMQDADSDARVVSVSAKDRAAVLMASHSRAHVYWFEAALGRFVTSVHYRDEYPGWVTAFNDDVLPTLVGDSVWRSEVPASVRPLARADTFPFEGDGVHTAFPHAFADLAVEGEDLERSFWPWFATTPALDAATLGLARAAVEAEGLGADGVPDLLAVSLSQTDRVGHGYGPGSLEQLDNLLRLDRELGAFMEWLDETVGAGSWVMAFTADHGVLEFPEVRVAEGRPGVRLTQDSVASLQRVVDRASGAAAGSDALAQLLAEGAPEVSWIDRAWLRSALEAGPAEPDSFTRLQLANFDAERQSGLLSRAGVELQFSEGVLTWAFPTGTTHGSPYLYDRQVPLILYGPGIAPGVSDDRVSINDVAPTLADLAGVPFPDDLDGVSRRPR